MLKSATNHVITDSAKQKQAWELRRLGLGLVSNIPGKAKAIALIEDACIPIENLPEYNQHVYAVGQELGLGISAYAHASVGVLHYKVMFDLHETIDRQKMRTMAEACFEKCLELGGVFSGEHGDGIVRGEFLKRQFGDEVYQAFCEVKKLFDPLGILNPNRKIEAPPLDSLLRYGDSDAERVRYNNTSGATQGMFRYGEQENLVVAIEQCNGVGACRKTLKGTMCPSYRATREERDSTRGRANLLRLAISGQLNPPGLANPELHEALDLCLACKACKSECPNAVDMARLKSEALQTRWNEQGVSPKARFVGSVPDRVALGAKAPWLAKLALKVPMARSVMQSRFGIDRRRTIPTPQGNQFEKWWKANHERGRGNRRTIALFVDTWNRYLEPEIGIAVCELLWSCGYKIELINAFDAQRTRLSVGLLTEAKRNGAKLFEQLKQLAEKNTPIVCIEPSEASALTDDLPDLIDDIELGRQVKQQVQLLDNFLAKAIADGDVQVSKQDPSDTRLAIVHTHCHQKALFGAEAPKQILEAAGYAVELPDLGCCGMAGSFGHMHYDVSVKIANTRFLPAIQAGKKKGAVFVATGTSCREQALDLAHEKLIHWSALITGKPT
ncbi:MAG: FAD-linked oxidase C-terminal domain-containing protein [Pirellulaceae bacterium]